MLKHSKTTALWAILLFAFGAYAWSVIAVYVTLGGSEERTLIAGDALQHAKMFGWYLVGPELPGASAGFWLGTTATLIAFTLSAKSRQEA